MKLEDIQLIKSDERGVIYQCGKSNFIVRKKGSVSANHKHHEAETLYLVQGGGILTVGDETQPIKAPIACYIKPDTYHKLVALTDITLIVDRNCD